MANQRKNNSSIKNTLNSKTSKKAEEKIIFPEDSLESKTEQNNKISKRNVVKESKEISPAFLKNDLINEISLEKPLYLQMAVENIYGVFSKGLILPHKLSGDNVFPDIQSVNPIVLILSNGVIGSIKNDLLLEIIFTKEELANVEVKDNTAVVKLPVPVSRIKRIYVNSEDVKSSIVVMSSINDGGIIPEKLISIIPKKLNQFQLPNLTYELTNGIELEVKLFDRILGTFAFLSNYSILTSSRTNLFQTLPNHFFYALQSINENLDISIVKNERATNFYKQLFNVKEGDSPIFSWLVNRLNTGANFHDEDVFNFANVLSDNITNKEFLKEIKPILASLNRSLERKSAIKNIPSLINSDKFYIYLFAVLRQYGNLNTEDKSISRADLPEFIHQSYGEYTFACLGYFYGYSSLRNYEEKVTIDDKVFINHITEKRLPLKFELNNLLNLNIIESVYQFVFNKRITNEIFNYVNNQSIVNISSIKSSSSIKQNEKYTEESIEVLGKLVYIIKKNNIAEKIEEQLAKIGRDIPAMSNLGLLCFRKSLPWYFSDFNLLFSNVDKIRYIIVFRKEDLLNGLKNQLFNIDEVLKALEIGFEYNEF